ncbi:MAG: NAD-dependent epimerase/dehydratase family protein [Planctomycetota bacterium]|jgi:UDP-sulfoquinovose synthase|nr:NAD-dependent epimerase/dehydratase family protein [Planctomycetota bacterium]
MRVFICGIEGYLGWSLACHLVARGHQLGGLDMGHRAQWVNEMGSQSAIPIEPIKSRLAALEDRYKMPVGFYPCDMRDGRRLADVLQDFMPEAVVHLAEQPSAPFSMIDRQHAYLTQEINTLGSLNLLWAMRQVDRSMHLVKLGTMGEYGTPDCPIPEGVFPVDSQWVDQSFDGQIESSHYLDGMQFPRDPGSLYHASKVHDTTNAVLLSRTWGLRITDVMQGVVYGTRIDAMGDDPKLATRFDFDEAFGTAINRFCAQATIGAPITPYGAGTQQRGFLPLCDSMQCLTLLLERPAGPGEYRVVNQWDQCYSITELAALIADVSGMAVQHITNPRKEKEQHSYDVSRQRLPELGYVPTDDPRGQIAAILGDLEPHADRIEAHRRVITPTITWDK